MDQELIIQGLDRLLDDWDPIGILQRFKPFKLDRKKTSGEYSKYVPLIINTYLANQSIYTCLANLHEYLLGININGEDWEEARTATIETSNRIQSFLSEYTREELEKAIK